MMLQNSMLAFPKGPGYHGPFAWQRAAMMNLGLGQSGSWGSPEPEKLPIEAVQFINGPANSKVPGGGRVVEMWGSTEVPDEAWEVMKFPLVDHEVQVGVFTILRDGLPAQYQYLGRPTSAGGRAVDRHVRLKRIWRRLGKASASTGRSTAYGWSGSAHSAASSPVRGRRKSPSRKPCVRRVI